MQIRSTSLSKITLGVLTECDWLASHSDHRGMMLLLKAVFVFSLGRFSQDVLRRESERKKRERERERAAGQIPRLRRKGKANTMSGWVDS